MAGALACAGFVLLVVLLYHIAVLAAPGNSDGATIILEGRSLATGHLTLHGWELSLDSFWMSDALVNAVFVTVLGVSYPLLLLVPAVVAVAVVFVGVRLATVGRSAGPAFLGGLTVFALIGLPTSFFAHFFIQDGLHVVTVLYVLTALLLLGHGHFDWRFGAAVVLLGAASVSDLLAPLFGIVPVGLAGLVEMLRRRSALARTGLVPVAAAAASAALAVLLRGLGDLVGTFYINGPAQHTSISQKVQNIRLSYHYWKNLLGIGTVPNMPNMRPNRAPGLLEDVHYLGYAMVLAAVVVVVRLVWTTVRGGGEKRDSVAAPGAGLAPTFVDEALVIGMVASVGIFIDLSFVNSSAFARYLVPDVIFGAIITGRLVASLATRRGPGVARRLLAGAVVLVTVCFAAGTADYLGAAPRTSHPFSGIVQFLEGHGLVNGLGDYGTASMVTVASGDHVHVRPVITGSNGRLIAYHRNSKTSWFTGTFNFFVYVPPYGLGGANSQAAELTWGPPSQIYMVRGYQVLVWASPHSLS